MSPPNGTAAGKEISSWRRLGPHGLGRTTADVLRARTGWPRIIKARGARALRAIPPGPAARARPGARRPCRRDKASDLGSIILLTLQVAGARSAARAPPSRGREPSRPPARKLEPSPAWLCRGDQGRAPGRSPAAERPARFGHAPAARAVRRRPGQT